MCTYSISLNDELVMQTRQSFASEALMATWIQQQVETMLTEYNARQQAVRLKARRAIEAMRSQSEQNGNVALTLDDINNEIRMARATRKAML